jgi:hypothetical protein
MLGERFARGCSDAWRSSRLTGDGFPFEIAFSTADDRLRFTLEPGGHDLDPHQRLDRASELMNLLSDDPVPPNVLQQSRAMQLAAPLKFGAWVGCRISEEGAAFKLYAEVPPGRLSSLNDLPLTLSDRTIIPRMFAYSPATGVFESYVRVPSLEPHHLPAVLAPAGLEAQAPWFINFIEEAYSHVVRGRLPGPSVGVSYVTERGSTRITLHFYARALWGSDARIRRGFSRVARAFDWDTERYLEMTAPMATRESWRCYHGIFGITLSRFLPTSLTIGLRPIAR